jgi:hypothetical protein
VVNSARVTTLAARRHPPTDLPTGKSTRCAASTDRLRSQNFIVRDEHGSPCRWIFRLAAACLGRLVLVDTRFGEESHARASAPAPLPDHRWLPSVALNICDGNSSALGHAGNLGKLPMRFHIRMPKSATRPAAACAMRAPGLFGQDVTDLIRHVYADRVVFRNGDADSRRREADP